MSAEIITTSDPTTVTAAVTGFEFNILTVLMIFGAAILTSSAS